MGAPTIEELEDFLASLPAGFAFGTAERIQVRRLLIALFADGELPDQLADLKTMLAPILCTNRDQQDGFYRLFDEHFVKVKPRSEPGSGAKRPEAKTKGALRWWAAALSLAALIAAGITYYRWNDKTPPAIIQSPTAPSAPTLTEEPDTSVSHPAVKVTGRVTTVKGTPVSGADVWIPGKHTSTDSDGKFNFDYTADGKSVPVLVGDPRYRANLSSSTFRAPPTIRLAELAERSLPAPGMMTATGNARSLWSFATGPAAFSAAADVFAIADGRGSADLYRGSLRSTVSSPAWQSPPLQMALSPSGSQLAVAGGNGQLEIISAKDGFTSVSFKDAAAPAFSPMSSGQTLAASDSKVRLFFWQQTTGEFHQSSPLPDKIQALAYRPDGSSLVVAGESWMWNFSLTDAKWTQLYPIEAGSKISDMQFDPTNHYMMLRNPSGVVDIWDGYGQRVNTPANWPTAAIGAGFTNGILRTASVERLDDRLRLLPWVAALLPIAVIAAWLYWLRRKRARLNRISLPREMSTYSLLAPTSDPPFRDVSIKKLGQEMRRRKPGLGLQLSLEASIQASARSAGFFVPVYRERTQQREFLILIEKIGRGDQQERFYRQLTEALSAYTYVELYNFQSSPANVRDHIAGGWIDLPGLAARYPEHDLWIIADPADFIDPVTLVIPEWMYEMPRWKECALLSPHHVHEALPALLAREGIPLWSVSLAGMTDLLTAPEARGTTAVRNLPVYPRILRRQPLQWVDNVSPGTDAVRDALGVLEGFLGREGMLLLRACAVYPETFWKLTLWLGNSLLTSSGGYFERAEVFARLVGLPWLRHGHIPNWMRVPLINGLGSDEERVRTLIGEFLQGVQHGDPELSVARRERGQPGKVWDYVMFSFLLGRKVDEKLAVKPPSLWMKMFFHRGIVVFGPRLWAHALVALLLSIGVWFAARAGIAHLPSRVAINDWKLPAAAQPPVARDFPPTPMRRALVEIADSMVGQPAPANWEQAVVTQASRFANGIPTLQAPVSTSTPAPGLLYRTGVNSGVIESVSGQNAVVIQSENGQVRRLQVPLPQGQFLDYVGCVAGQSWQRIAIGVGTNQVVFTVAGTPNGNHLIAVTSDIDLVNGSGYILISSDRGQHWRYAGTPSGDKEAALVGAFITDDERNAWVVGEHGTVLTSIDMGKTWKSVLLPGPEFDLRAVFGTPDGLKLWLVGSQGAIFSSTDSGRTWSTLHNGTRDLSTVVGARDGKYLWAVGDGGTAILSRDFGKSWTSKDLGTKDDLWGGFSSANGKEVVISSSSGAIFVSSDFGGHFRKSRDGSNPETDGIAGITGTTDGSYLWAFGQKGVILQSMDAGNTWKQQPSPVHMELARGFLTDNAQTIWVGGENGVLLKSDVRTSCAQPATQQPSPPSPTPNKSSLGAMRGLATPDRLSAQPSLSGQRAVAPVPSKATVVSLVPVMKATVALNPVPNPDNPPPVRHPIVHLMVGATSLSGLTSYNIYRSATHGGPYNKIASIPVPGAYDDQSVVFRTSYYYVGTVIRADGTESGYSAETSVRTPTEPGGAPDGL